MEIYGSNAVIESIGPDMQLDMRHLPEIFGEPPELVLADIEIQVFDFDLVLSFFLGVAAACFLGAKLERFDHYSMCRLFC